MSTPENPETSPLVSGSALSADAVLDRMKQAWRAESDSALAKSLQTSRQSISKWRSRNSVPYAEAVFTSYSRLVSLDWLLKGEGEKIAYPNTSAVINADLAQAVLKNLMESKVLHLSEFFDDTAIASVSKMFVRLYSRGVRTKELLMHEDHMSEEEAFRVAISATELMASDLGPFNDWSVGSSKRGLKDGSQ